MKYILTIAIAFFSLTTLVAQQEYDELLELIVDEKYERCLYKAVKYTEKDATKKDPLPYVYMSMAFFRISESDDPALQDKFPKASKEAVKYLVKFVKKDKESEFVGQFKDYISEVRVAMIAEAEQQADDEKYTRAKGLYKYLTDIDEKDPGAWLMRAHAEYMMRSKKDARDSWEQARLVLEERGTSGLTDEQLSLLKMAVIRNAEMLDQEGEREQARELLKSTSEYFGDDREFNVTYNSIVG